MVILIKQYGQLGNRLFPYAQFVAHAHKHNYRLLNPAFEDYSEYFKNTDKTLFGSYPPTIVRSSLFTKKVRRKVFRFIEKGVNFAIRKKWMKSWIHEIVISEPSKHFHSDEKFVKLVKRKFVFICTPFHFRDEATLHSNLDIAVNFLKLKDEHQKNVTNLVDQARENSEIVIGMHIRGGDFRDWLDGRFFYDVHYFQAAVKKAEKLFEGKKVSFIICSNEEWDIKNFEGSSIYFGTGHLAEDMYTLSQTDYIIGGYSSYAYWAALSGNVPLFSMLDKNILEESFDISDFKDVRTFGSIP